MRDCHVTWEGLFMERRRGEKVGGGWGNKYWLHCETEAGDSQLGLVTDSVKYSVNTQGIWCFWVHIFLKKKCYLLDIFNLILTLNPSEHVMHNYFIWFDTFLLFTETHCTKGQQVHIHQWQWFDSYLAIAPTWLPSIRLIDQKECLFQGWVGWPVTDEKGFKCFTIVD